MLELAQLAGAGFAALLAVEQFAVWRAHRGGGSVRLGAGAAATAAVFVTNAGTLAALDRGAAAAPWLLARSVSLSLLAISTVGLVVGIFRGGTARLLLALLVAVVAARTVLWPTTNLLYAHRVVDGLPQYGALEAPLGALLLAIVFGALCTAAWSEKARADRVALSAGITATVALSVLSLTYGESYRAELLTGYVPLPALVAIALVVWRRQQHTVRLVVRHAQRERALADLARSAITARLDDVEARADALASQETAEFRAAVDAVVEAARSRATLESELRRAHRLEVAGRLAAGIAHDFNNVLLAQRGLGDVALRELERGAVRPASGHVSAMLEVVDRAAGLTRQLLSFARRQGTEPDVVDLNAVVRELGSWLRHLIGANVRLSYRVASRPAYARCDRGQIEQVLVNLALNARDAMPDGGTIEISVHPPGRDGMARLEVRDDGVGMQPETEARIFDPFFSTKGDAGTGLGLAIVHGIVTQAGGTIAVATAPAVGTTFAIALPAVDGPATRASDRETEDEPRISGTGRAALLVEDDPIVRDVVAEMLDFHGYRVFRAESIDAAQALAREYCGPIDVLITDVTLADATGTAVAAAVRNVRPAIAVLYISGHPADAIDPAQFLQKPFGDADLAAAVERVLAGSSPG